MKKSILITGATSGIGEYASRILAERGWVVWAGYRSLLNHKVVSHENVRPLELDVTDAASVQRARKTIEQSGIPLHALLNNAGVGLGGPLELLDIEEIRNVYEVNVFGNIRVTQVFLPLLRKHSGRIINMSSIAGITGVPFMIPYSSSKFAVEGISEGLRRELSKQKIHVSTIEPGPIKTALWDKSLRQSVDALGKSLEPYWSNPDQLDKFLASNQKHFVRIETLHHAILHAAESARPKARYLVYPTNWLVRLLVRLSPTSFIDAVFRHVLKRVE